MNTALSIDVRTLIQATVFVSMLSTIILIFTWRTRITYPGFGYWVIQSAGITVGLEFVRFTPAVVCILTGNALILFSALLALKAIKVFFDRGPLNRGYWVALAFVESGMIWFTCVTPHIGIRVVLMSFSLGFILSVIAWELLFRAPVKLRVSSRFTGAVFLAYGIFFLFRGFATLLWTPVSSNFSPNIVQITTFFASMAVSLLGAFGFIMMNTQRLEHEVKTTADKLQTSLHELEQKTNEIKTLSGLLPICASCKKIRNDKGYWEHIEIYIRDHSQADFSHGICPDCGEKLYPEHYKKKK